MAISCQPRSSPKTASCPLWWWLRLWLPAPWDVDQELCQQHPGDFLRSFSHWPGSSWWSWDGCAGSWSVFGPQLGVATGEASHFHPVRSIGSIPLSKDWTHWSHCLDRVHRLCRGLSCRALLRAHVPWPYTMASNMLRCHDLWHLTGDLAEAVTYSLHIAHRCWHWHRPWQSL